MKPSLSALIIAKDEERDLPGCLESLQGLADEIVVLVDDSTTDGTERIARDAGCKVARRKFDDYASQRQAALELCTKEWVLWIDCDESVSSELKASVTSLFAREGNAGVNDGYIIPFTFRFLGKTLRFGGMGSEMHLRLFRRSKSRFVGGQLHEAIEISGNGIAFMPGDGTILHQSYVDIPDYLAKLDRYTTLSAEKKFAAGQRFRFWHRLIAPWEFVMRVFIKLGFLDGRPGIVWARLSARHSALKYAKLRELELKK